MGNLLFGPNGRISPSDFMRGATILIVVQFILGLLPLISMGLAMVLSIVSIVIIYPWVCLFMKRLRDGGKSGWLCIAVILVWIVLSMIIGMVINTVMMAGAGASQEAMQAAAESGDLSTVMDAAGSMAKKTAIPSAVAGAVVSYLIAFIVNKVIPHDANDNQYGPETH